MKGSWKDLFAFNKRERNGILVLISLIIFLLIIQVLMPLFVVYPVFDNSEKVKSYLAILKQDSVMESERVIFEKNKIFAAKRKRNQNQYSKKYNRAIEKKSPMVWDPISFDPNNAKIETWERFSLSRKQATSILNYVFKGGVFKVKGDVSKMYVVDKQLYAKMKPFILLPDSLVKIDGNLSYKNKGFSVDTLVIELNQTDTTQLKKLKGIGSYYARQIIFYRDKLGGYYAIEQLYEIERMRTETVQKILPFIKVDKNRVKKIKINSYSAPEMVRHPYITWNMAIGIQDYRDFTRKFKSTHQLVEIGLLNEEIYSKLVPYLEL